MQAMQCGRIESRFSCQRGGQLARQRLASSCVPPVSTRSRKRLRQLVELGRTDAHVHADAHVRLASWDSAPASADSMPTVASFAAWPVEVVALEHIAEEVRLQVLVDGRCEIEQCALDRATGELGLVGRAGRQQCLALGDGATR